jgi:hypothetical protein
MAIWGIAFGIAATLTGMFLMGAIEGGFLAEGFFLIVISWVLLLVAVAKIADRIRRRGASDGPEEHP